MCFQGDALIHELCTGPWPGPESTVSLNLIVGNIQRNVSVRGGPFFTLNMEFFTSILGTVLAYFVVLIQFRG